MTDRTRPPTEAPEYRRALYGGLLPVVPGSPPTPIVGTSAAARFDRWLITAVGSFAGSIAFGLLVSNVAAAPSWLWAVVAAALTAALVGTARRLGTVGDRVALELQHGYTTLTITQGTFWMPALRRPFAAGPRPVPWNFSGTWVLDRHGRPSAGAPDRTILPPGFYPSPRRRGMFELWSGAMWTGNFRTGAQVAELRRTPGAAGAPSTGSVATDVAGGSDPG